MYPAVSIDFETSGTGGNSACAIGMARVEDGQVVNTFYRLIRPPSSRVYFTHVHGLTWGMLKDQPTFAELWDDIHAFLDGARWLVAHNAPFDRRVLAISCSANGLTAPNIPFLCTLKGARRSLTLPSKGLDAVCDHFGITLTHHHAESDARAAAEIYLRLTALGLAPESMRS